MVDYHIEVGEKEIDALIALQLDAPGNAKRRKKLRIFYGIYMLLLLLAFFINYPGVRDEISILLIVLFGIFLYFMVGFKSIQRRKLKRAYKNADPAVCCGKRHYTLDENGINTESAFQKSHYDWDALGIWQETDEYYFLLTRTGGILVFRRGDLSQEEDHALQQLVAEHLPSKG